MKPVSLADTADVHCQRQVAHQDPLLHFSPEEVQEYKMSMNMMKRLVPLIKGKKPKARKRYLAACIDSQRKETERVLKTLISRDEWTDAKKHFHHPGPFMEEPKIEADHVSRSKVNHELIVRMAQFFEGPGRLQRYAFGQKVIELCRGVSLTVLDNVDRLQKARTIAVKFILAIDAELSVPAPHDLSSTEALGSR